MKILPHLTERDIRRSQQAITALQQEDIRLLNTYAGAFRQQARAATDRYAVPVVVLCNLETDEVIPSPLDWNGTPNVLQLDDAIYATAKHALERADARAEIVVLMYRPAEDLLSIYTVSPEDPRDNVGEMFGSG